ncbi:MAG: hypothetical protein P8X50_06690 [Maritimibacter sp.]|jgi:hypothetical protein
MKKFMVAAAAVLTAPAAFAGSLADPIVEPEIVVEQATSSSSAGILVPLLLVAIIAAAIWKG